ncbi:MAG TPA: TerC family protein [Bdellovibrionota bacterium]|nr:TerC family protein [Bdellovibrionota bacterium]
MANWLTLDSLAALVSLSAMEIVLGIDNIVFIAILAAKVHKEVRTRVRMIGISLALVARLGLLFSITWIMKLTEPLFSIVGQSFSGRDLILLVGGLFLIAKATYEIHEKLESGPGGIAAGGSGNRAVGPVIFQIVLIDLVFSLDSVITAVGMTQKIPIMVVAMVLAVAVMMISSGKISDFVHHHPTIKILALAFLLMIGVMLFAEGMGVHIQRGYIYFAMAFSLAVEFLNLRYRKRHQPVELREPQNP